MFEVQATPTLSLSNHRLQVGDHVVIVRDVLAELARDASGLPMIYFCVPVGVRGRVIGWLDREEENPRAIVDLSTEDRHLVIYVGEHNVARVRGHGPSLAIPSVRRAATRPRIASQPEHSPTAAPARPRRTYRHRHR